jgi:hypothetical protein
MSYMSALLLHVVVSATDRSLVQSSVTIWDVSLLYVVYKHQELGGPGSRRTVAPEGQKYVYNIPIYSTTFFLNITLKSTVPEAW